MKNKRKSSLKWIADFLKTVRSLLIVYAMTVGAFSIVYFFGRLPFAFWWYSVELSGFLLLVYLLVRLYFFVRDRHILYAVHADHMTELNRLSTRNQPSDARYAELLHELELRSRETEETAADRRTEQLDYFTLWLHQIKTPISAVSLLMQRAEDRVLAQKVHQELLRIENYTMMALNYIKLEDTGADLELERISLDDMIKKCIKRYSILFIYNHISLEYTEITTQVLSDKKWLQVLLEQILSNSLKYAIEGEIAIYMDPHRGKTLVIEDDGSGIRAEDLPKIFNKGYSGFNGKTYEKSTGLGLFLSQKICRRLGHRIAIDSTLDVGTKVFIDFSRENLELYD